MEADTLGLRKWRTEKGISLDAIALATKLSIRQLEAIESGNFSRLPGGIYSTSYIRQYARAIQFDEAALLEFYESSISKSSSAEELKSAPRGLSRPLFQS